MHVSVCVYMCAALSRVPVCACTHVCLCPFNMCVCVFMCVHTQADYIRKKNKFLKPIHDWVAAHGGEPIIPFSGAYEAEVGLRHTHTHAQTHTHARARAAATVSHLCFVTFHGEHEHAH